MARGFIKKYRIRRRYLRKDRLFQSTVFAIFMASGAPLIFKGGLGLTLASLVEGAFSFVAFYWVSGFAWSRTAKNRIPRDGKRFADEKSAPAQPPPRGPDR